MWAATSVEWCAVNELRRVGQQLNFFYNCDWSFVCNSLTTDCQDLPTGLSVSIATWGHHTHTHVPPVDRVTYGGRHVPAVRVPSPILPPPPAHMSVTVCAVYVCVCDTMSACAGHGWPHIYIHCLRVHWAVMKYRKEDARWVRERVLSKLYGWCACTFALMTCRHRLSCADLSDEPSLIQTFVERTDFNIQSEMTNFTAQIESQ